MVRLSDIRDKHNTSVTESRPSRLGRTCRLGRTALEIWKFQPPSRLSRIYRLGRTAPIMIEIKVGRPGRLARIGRTAKIDYILDRKQSIWTENSLKI